MTAELRHAFRSMAIMQKPSTADDTDRTDDDDRIDSKSELSALQRRRSDGQAFKFAVKKSLTPQLPRPFRVIPHITGALVALTDWRNNK
jgi:hypothetical protein